MKRVVLFGFPVLFLVLHFFRSALPLPAALLPRRVVLAPGSDPQFVLAGLERYGTLLLPAEDGLLELKRADLPTLETLTAFLAQDRPVPNLAEAVRRVVPLLPRLSRILLLVDRIPSAAEVRDLRALQAAIVPSLALRAAEAPYDPLFMAYACTYSSQESQLAFDLEFSRRVAEYRTLEVRLDGRLLARLRPDELDQGREYRASFAVPAAGGLSLDVELAGAGPPVRRQLRLLAPSPEEPQVLLVTEKPPARSLLDALYRVKRISPAQAGEQGLASCPLLVFDGVPLRAFDPRLTAAVAELHRRGAASLLFVSDGPQFGRKGDNPRLEQLLPVELAPRSLRYLPDLGILILLDVSASMMGEKLSLAKVSTLELLANLKDSDRVSIVTFWDQYRTLHGFRLRSLLSAEVELAPLLAEGGTDLYPPLADGLARLSELDMKERHVLILSDGKTKEGDFASLLREARRHDISISTIAVGQEVNAELLARIAQGTGGRYYRVLNLEQIPSIIFEDRKEAARASFARDLFTIVGSGKAPLGEVTGMSLFTPKPGRAVLLRNQFDDPLLLVDRAAQQFLGAFLSDLYGTYTGGLFSNPRAVDLLRSLLEPVLRRTQVTVRYAEAFRTLVLTVDGEGLVEPRLELYGAGGVAADKPLEPGAFHTYHAELPVAAPGAYTAVIYSQGVPQTRFPIYYNGSMEGLQTDAPRELLSYRPKAFVLLPAGNGFLVLFFLASVAATWLARRVGS